MWIKPTEQGQVVTLIIATGDRKVSNKNDLSFLQRHGHSTWQNLLPFDGQSLT